MTLYDATSPGYCGTCRSIEFVCLRDGLDASIAFARQTVRSYRRAVLKTHGLVARRGLIEAYLCAKRTVDLDNRTAEEPAP